VVGTGFSGRFVDASTSTFKTGEAGARKYCGIDLTGCNSSLHNLALELTPKSVRNSLGLDYYLIMFIAVRL
jgi:hypothetical protein